MTEEPQATATHRVSASFMHTDGATGKKTVLFPEEGVRVPLTDEYEPEDGETTFTDSQQRHIEDMKGFFMGKNATVTQRQKTIEVDMPMSPVKWVFDKDWNPKNWGRAPNRPEAHGIYFLIHKHTGRVRNPEELMQHG